MSQALIKLVVLILSLDGCVPAVNQTVRYFEHPDFSGNSVTITRKMANLDRFYSRFIGESKSMCLEGWWIPYRRENFEVEFGLGRDFGRKCWRESIRIPYQYLTAESIRHLGPANTATESISLYARGDYDGQELVIETEAEAGVPFHPLSAFVTGHSNWTFYEQPNFGGAFRCFESKEDVELIPMIEYDKWGLTRIGSVRRGCEEWMYVKWEKVDSIWHQNELENELEEKTKK